MSSDPSTIPDESEYRGLVELQLRDDYKSAARKYIDGTDKKEWYEIIHDYDFGTSEHELMIYALLVTGSAVKALDEFWKHAITSSLVDDEMDRRANIKSRGE